MAYNSLDAPDRIPEEVEEFMTAHGQLVEMLAHVIPLDVTAQVFTPHTEGRVTLEATMQPPTITETAYMYRETIGGFAVNMMRTKFEIVGGQLLVSEQDEIQDDPDEGGVLPKIWRGGEYEILEGEESEDAANEVFDVVDEIYKQSAVALALQQQS